MAMDKTQQHIGEGKLKSVLHLEELESAKGEGGE